MLSILQLVHSGGSHEHEPKKVPLHHSKWTQGGDKVDIQALQNLKQ